MSVDQRPEARPPGPTEVVRPAYGNDANSLDVQGLGAHETERLVRRALRLAQVTAAYHVVEGVVAIVAGLVAGLVSVVGFGLDSAIGSVAGVLIALRLAARLRRKGADERTELRALRVVAVAFYLLAGYVTIAGIHVLVSGTTPERSPVAIGLLVVSVVVMPLLAGAKRRIGTALDDPLVLADAAETRIGVLVSFSTLVGLVVFVLTGAAWVDALAGFVIAGFAIHEGREAWLGELANERHGDPAAEACED